MELVPQLKPCYNFMPTQYETDDYRTTKPLPVSIEQMTQTRYPHQWRNQNIEHPLANKSKYPASYQNILCPNRVRSLLKLQTAAARLFVTFAFSNAVTCTSTRQHHSSTYAGFEGETERARRYRYIWIFCFKALFGLRENEEEGKKKN